LAFFLLLYEILEINPGLYEPTPGILLPFLFKDLDLFVLGLKISFPFCILVYNPLISNVLLVPVAEYGLIYAPGPGVEIFHFKSVPLVSNLFVLKLKVLFVLLNLFSSIDFINLGS